MSDDISRFEGFGTVSDIIDSEKTFEELTNITYEDIEDLLGSSQEIAARNNVNLSDVLTATNINIQERKMELSIRISKERNKSLMALGSRLTDIENILKEINNKQKSV